MPTPFASLGHLLSTHPAITRLAVAAIFLTPIIALSETPTQATPQLARPVAQSLLPQALGVAIPSDDAITITFDQPMNPASVEAALRLVPSAAANLSWNDDRNALSIEPQGRWRTDASFLVILDQSATTADGEGLPSTRRYTFTTQTAPTVTAFQVRLAGVDLARAEGSDGELSPLRLDRGVPGQEMLSTEETARDVSASSSVRIGFSAPMGRPDVEAAFRISPDVGGELSWSDGDLVFTPSERLEPGGRYTISLAGAHDRAGNQLGGKANFSFVVRAGPQLVRTTPALDATDVEPATVEMWFSQPMDVDATNAAFGLVDTTTGALVAGWLNWNEAATQLVYSPQRPLAGGRTFEVTLGAGARNAEGDPLAAQWAFSTAEAVAPPPAATTTRAAAPIPPVAAPPAGASGLEGYALAQINSARAAYGLGPLALDPAISAVSAAHAWDQLTYGYYSHNSRNGATVQQRLAAAGIGYSAAGENQCYHDVATAQATIDWCHSVFMSEPWPGYPNHIGNILSSRYTRFGVGIADNGSRVVITWDFAN